MTYIFTGCNFLIITYKQLMFYTSLYVDCLPDDGPERTDQMIVIYYNNNNNNTNVCKLTTSAFSWNFINIRLVHGIHGQHWNCRMESLTRSVNTGN
jgi:hypothetical protein